MINHLTGFLNKCMLGPKKNLVRFRFPTDPAQIHATQKSF